MPDPNVRVICRFRPENEREKNEIVQGKEGVTMEFINGTTVQVTIPPQEPKLYTFDRVFHDDVEQAEVFEVAARQTVEDVLAGYNGTIFAYGQTGSGKTHTMFGPDITSDRLKGIIPRACSLIFDHIEKQQGSGTEFTVKCSFLEIYKEVIHDLLDPTRTNLKVRETPSMGVWVEGLSEKIVYNEQQILDLLKQGEQFRSVSKTLMNATSSRSHSLFIITVIQKLRNGSTKTGKLNLADLAGSEKVSKTGASGETLEEAKKINQSLSALGKCIMALTKSKKSHVPYRDSKLTFILRESLGGNAKTTLLIACSPHVFNLEETLSTLRFGQRAKAIKNKVKINHQRSVQELELIIKKLTFDLKILRQYTALIEAELQSCKDREFDIEALRKRLLDQIHRQLDGDDRRYIDSLQSSPSSPALVSSVQSSPNVAASNREVQSPYLKQAISSPQLDDTRDFSKSPSITRSRSSIMIGTASTAEFPATPVRPLDRSPLRGALASPLPLDSPITPTSPTTPKRTRSESLREETLVFDPMALAEARAAYDTLKEETDLRIQELTEEINMLKEQLKEAQANQTTSSDDQQIIESLKRENEALRAQLAQMAVSQVGDLLSTKPRNYSSGDLTNEEVNGERSDVSIDGDSLPRDLSEVSSTFSSLPSSAHTSAKRYLVPENGLKELSEQLHGKNRPSGVLNPTNSVASDVLERQLFYWMTMALKLDAMAQNKHFDLVDVNELYESLVARGVPPSLWPSAIQKALETNTLLVDLKSPSTHQVGT